MSKMSQSHGDHNKENNNKVTRLTRVVTNREWAQRNNHSGNNFFHLVVVEEYIVRNDESDGAR